MPKPQPSANTSGSLALGPRHQYFLKAPKGFYHLARYGIHWAKVSQWGHWASTCQLKVPGTISSNVGLGKQQGAEEKASHLQKEEE